MLLHASRTARPTGPTPFALADLVGLTRRVAAEVRADVWLISWATDQATELHDHAGSLGALSELRWTGELCDRRLRAGRSVGFPLGHVHDVVNAHDAPAVSVHAYSPPLTAMSYPPHRPGPGVTTIDGLLAAARARLDRVDPHRAAAQVKQGALTRRAKVALAASDAARATFAHRGSSSIARWIRLIDTGYRVRMGCA